MKKDLIDPNNTTRYYYNNNWQVLSETNADDVTQRWFIYGNYIDEALLMKADGNDHYYAHDHLYSPAALIDSSGTVVERYEYDAYGNPTIRNYTRYEPLWQSVLVYASRVDILHSGSLKIQYKPNPITTIVSLIPSLPITRSR